MAVRYYPNEAIEQRVVGRLAALELVLGERVRLPVPIDLLAEHVLGLDVLWEEIDELPGEIVLGGLIPERRLIVLNDRHRTLFRAKPGLERSTKGHEMGHWDLFVDQALLDQPQLPDLAPGAGTVLRGSPAGQVQVLQALLRDPDGVELLRDLLARADDPAEARAVNRYAAAVSMPHTLLRERVDAHRPDGWRSLYRLAAEFEVTISALKVRLEQLGLLFVTERGRVYASRAEAAGQLRLL
jgi:hypothetical protein